MKQNDCLIVLDKSGKMLSSEEFANFLNEKMINQTRRICFLIGSEIGLDDFFKKSGNVFSFGNQTWPHLIIRIMLIEQIYRSLEILKCSPYHK